MNLTEFQLQIWDDEHGERLEKFYACSEDKCRTLADKDVGDARVNFERRKLAHLERAAEQCRDLGRADLDRIEGIIRTRLDEHDTDTKDNGCRCTACCREKFRRISGALAAQGMAADTSGIPVGNSPLDALTAAVMAQIDNVLRNDPPTSVIRMIPLRPDGFAQSQVDAAKAVLLASVPWKGNR